MNCLVTGGAGFIGSNLVDQLLVEGHSVKIFDNLSTGKKEFISHNLSKPNFSFIEADLEDFSKLNAEMKGVEMVFHLAAHADVRSGFEDHNIDHKQNLEMTRNVLEAMSKNNVDKIMFSSTSSVYGDAKIHPTPEDYPFEPTSLYGASKAAAESYIHTFTSYYGMKSYIFRFVSFTGERYTHGLIFDVLKKIKNNSREIDLFSDGTPKKSSIYVKDGIDAILKVINFSNDQFNVYNIGHDEVVTVADIVNWVVEESGNLGIKLNWQGKLSNWKGDNEFVHLSNLKLKNIGWKPAYSIERGVKNTAKYIIDNFDL